MLFLHRLDRIKTLFKSKALWIRRVNPSQYITHILWKIIMKKVCVRSTVWKSSSYVARSFIFFLNIEKCTNMKQKKAEKLTVHICISLRFTQWIRLRGQWQSAVKMFNISTLCLEFEWFRDNSSLPHTPLKWLKSTQKRNSLFSLRFCFTRKNAVILSFNSQFSAIRPIQHACMLWNHLASSHAQAFEYWPHMIIDDSNPSEDRSFSKCIYPFHHRSKPILIFVVDHVSNIRMLEFAIKMDFKIVSGWWAMAVAVADL